MRRETQPLVYAVALLLAGCAALTEPEPEALPEDIGTKVVDGMVFGGVGTQLVWSADGGEIYYLSSGQVVDLQEPWTWMIETEIAAVDADSSTSRILATLGPEAGELRLSADGAWLYHYTMTWDPTAAEPFGDDPEQSFVYARVPVESGPPETLVEKAPYHASGDVSIQYALSPDGRVLAFHRGWETPITLYDIAQATESELDLTGAPVQYSPSGSELLFTSGDDLSLVSLEDETVTPFVSEIPNATAGLHWEGDRLELVSVREVEVEGKWYSEFRVWVTDNQGMERAVTAEGELRHENSGRLALSPDGTQVAAWFWDCLEGSWSTCDVAQSVLYLIDIESGDVTRIGATRLVPVFLMEFSPDGSRLAYGYGFRSDAGYAGDLYVHQLP